MAGLAVLPPIYCLFMLNCIDIQHGTVSHVDVHDESNNLRIACPEFCDCYRAPKERLSVEMNSFSLICNRRPIDDTLKDLDIPSRSLKVNTIVLQDGSIEGYAWILKYFQPKSIVITDTSPEIADLFDENYLETPLEANYVTAYKRANNIMDWFKYSKGIHIEDCALVARMGGSNVNDIILMEGNFPRLDSLTIKNSQISSLRFPKKTNVFSSESPLKMLDFSYNCLKRIDILTRDKRYLELTQLYLNDNHLRSLPKNFQQSFPNLKILHLQHNYFTVLSYEIVRQFLQIDECLLFAPKDSKLEKIYYFKEMEDWIPQIGEKSLNSFGIEDSFINSVAYKCSEKTEQTWLGLAASHCLPYHYHPDRIYTFGNSKMPHFLKAAVEQQKISLEGYSVEIPLNICPEYHRVNIDYREDYNMVRLHLDEWNNFQNSFFLLNDFVDDLQDHLLFEGVDLDPNYRKFMFIISTLKLKGETDFDWIIHAAQDILEVFAFEPVYVDEYFASFELNIHQNDCPLDKNKYDELYTKIIKPFTHFVDQVSILETSTVWKYTFILQIHLESLPLLRLLFNSEMLKACNLRANIKPFTLRIDAIDIKTENPSVKSYEDQLEQLRRHKSDQLFDNCPLIITLPGKGDVDKVDYAQDIEMFKEISENYIIEEPTLHSSLIK